MEAEHDGVQAVAALHDDLAAWMGRGDREAWRRFAAALAPGFVQIAPDGRRHARAAVLAAVEALGGRHGEGFAIRIADAVPRTMGEVVVVTYREVQSGSPLAAPDRASTALLAPDADGRMRWEHLHETWCG